MKLVLGDRSVAVWAYLLAFVAFSSLAGEEMEKLSLEEAKRRGTENSKYRNKCFLRISGDQAGAPKANLVAFHKDIQPLLEQACVQCHGPDKQKPDFRVDTLDPNLLTGKDVSWWVEVVDVISNGEMPPADDDIELSGEGRSKIVDWLTHELQLASHVRRSEIGHTSFRRLTRYEYNYALQDLLGLTYDLAGDLPPETASEDGFKNSSEMLQMSITQLDQYRDLGRNALQGATVSYRVSEEVILIDRDQEIKRQEVEPIWKDRDYIVVKACHAGLCEGDVLCITSLAYPVDGSPVLVTIDGIAPKVEKAPSRNGRDGKGGDGKGKSA